LSIGTVAKPNLLMVAGPNGSGKTTLTTRLREMGLDFGEYINADEIALDLPAGHDRDRLAQIEADRRRARALQERRSFSFETVMSHPSKIDEMREARAAGYRITFVGVALQDPELNVQRVALRVSEGGHDVPRDRIIARYFRTLALMPRAIAIAHRTLIFDNSDSEEGPMLVLTTRHSPDAHDTDALTVRISPELSRRPDLWAMRHVVTGLKQLQSEAGLALQFGSPFDL
jgi:predicted ABC-type ATPase